jgi:hypothetical protein
VDDVVLGPSGLYTLAGRIIQQLVRGVRTSGLSGPGSDRGVGSHRRRSAYRALGDRCPRCLIRSLPPASGLLPDGVRLARHYCGSCRDLRSFSDRTFGPTSAPVEVRADPRLHWQLTGRPFPSRHPRTLCRVLDTRPDQLRDNISFIRACGGHGTFLLELACSRMLRGEKVMSRGTFCWQTRGRTKRSMQVPPLPLPKFEDFSRW